jgi:hypothetical protein
MPEMVLSRFVSLPDQCVVRLNGQLDVMVRLGYVVCRLGGIPSRELLLSSLRGMESLLELAVMMVVSRGHDCPGHTRACLTQLVRFVVMNGCLKVADRG